MSETETNIQWSQQIDQMLASWCDNAKCFEYMHNESYDYNSTQSRKMTMFITVLTALLFIVMAYAGQWFGMLCMGGAFVCSLMAIKYDVE